MLLGMIREIVQVVQTLIRVTVDDF